MNSGTDGTSRLFILLSLLALAGIVLSALVLSTAEPGEAVPVNLRMWVATGNQRRTALELTGRDDTFQVLPGDQAFADHTYVYLYLELTNQTNRYQPLILHNQASNYYTELMKPLKEGAVTLYRHGDIVPLSQSPVRYRRAAFPLTLDPGEKVELLLEYHGPRGIVLAPRLSRPVAFFQFIGTEYSRMAFFYGIALALCLFLLGAAFFLKQPAFLGGAVFAGSVFFFALRQSRFLLHLIVPFSYPDWLFPLSISMNLLAALFFGWLLLKPWIGGMGRTIILGLSGVILFLTLLSFFIVPYNVADILNIISIGVLLFLLTRLYKGLRQGATHLLWLLLSFLPWIVVMLADILLGYVNFRLIQFEEDQHMLGILATLSLLTLLFLILYREHAAPPERAEAARFGMAEAGGLTRLRSSIIQDMAGRISLPLETVAAAGKIVERYRKEPALSSAGRVIRNEVEQLRELLQTGFGRYQEGAGELQETVGLLSAHDGDSFGNVRIYDPHREDAFQLALILQSDRFAVSVESDSYRIMEAAARGEMDLLLLSASGGEDRTIQLCRLIRGEHNMMELPIMMVLKNGSQEFSRKAYAAGVNDLLTLPFREQDLSMRVGSLIKLREVSLHNRELSRSEKEKNIFLYFLTHNVNTPLTILINRVQELEERLDKEDMAEIVEDLQATSQEISDIVRNVLISFRIADGRHTLFMEHFDPGSAFIALEKEMVKKSAMKGQTLTFSLPGEPVSIHGDATAFKGVLYNLVDNAIKYTPSGGSIEVLARSGSSFQVEVRDSGPGISREERPRLFRRFESLSSNPTGGESSTGLGLYVARELARMGGGDVELIHSERGAAFLLTLPLSTGEAEDAGTR